MKWLVNLIKSIFPVRQTVLRRERKTTVYKSSGNNENFDSLVEAFSELAEKFILSKGGDANVNFHISYKHTNLGVEERYEDGVIKCASCGGKNRLKRGIKGALCGTCKTSLERTFN